MKKTFLELSEIDQRIASVYKNNPDIVKTKFAYGYGKFVKNNLSVLQDEFKDKLLDIRIENALTDPQTGEILNDKENERGFKFSKEGLKETIRQEKKLYSEYENKEIEIKPYEMKVDFIPNDIKEAFINDSSILNDIFISK